jgi:predicted nucleic acid-binding protein
LQDCYESPEGTDRYTKELLLELHMPQVILDGIKEYVYISTEISQVENSQGWQKRRLALAEPAVLTMDQHYAV